MDSMANMKAQFEPSYGNLFTGEDTETCTMSDEDLPKAPVDETVVSRSESDQDTEVPEKKGSVLNVLVQGVALFSDGYNVQIIGYMQTVMAKL